MKKIFSKPVILIISIISLIVLCAAAWAINLYIAERQFKTAVMEKYLAYKMLVDDSNRAFDKINGQQYDDIYKEIDGYLQKEQSIKAEVIQMVPPSETAKAIQQQFIATLNAADESLLSRKSYYMAQQNVKIQSFDTWSREYFMAIQDEKKKASAASAEAKVSVNERIHLQTMLGVEIDKTP